MTCKLASWLAALGIVALGAFQAAAQESVVTIFGDIDSATANPFDIMVGDDVVVTATYTTTTSTGAIDPDSDPLLIFLLDIFADGTMISRLATPFTQADDFGFPSGDGPLYALVAGELDQINFATESVDPSLTFGATGLSGLTPAALLTLRVRRRS